MSVWASVADIEAVYEETVPDRAAALLDNAETLLAALVPTIAARITAHTLSVDLVRITLVDAVIRALRNPRGYSWEREGDYSYGLPLNRGQDPGTGGITFHPSELERLRPFPGASVGTIPLGDPYSWQPAYRWTSPQPDTWTEDRLQRQRDLSVYTSPDE
jgi:hypothetical protein